jgi:hypothetical protein
MSLSASCSYPVETTYSVLTRLQITLLLGRSQLAERMIPLLPVLVIATAGANGTTRSVRATSRPPIQQQLGRDVIKSHLPFPQLLGARQSLAKPGSNAQSSASARHGELPVAAVRAIEPAARRSSLKTSGLIHQAQGLQPLAPSTM